jgi:tRNA(Ile)-lysidine synthase
VGRGHRHALKNLLQEWGVPPWERSRVPLLYVEEDIAAVVGYCVCEPYQAGSDEAGIIVTYADR